MVKGRLNQHVMQNVSTEMFAGATGKKLMNDNIAALEREVTNKPGSAELHNFLKSVSNFLARNAAAKASGDGKADGERAAGLSIPLSQPTQP